MLILLPVACFLLLVLSLLGRVRQTKGVWQGDFLLATALWGAWLVILTEALSSFGVLSPLSLAMGWLMGSALALSYGWFTGRLVRGWFRVRTLLTGLSSWGWMLLGSMAGVAALLFAVAVVAPPNNVDALQYHMPRALHWIQNQSLEHYPVARHAQNNRPYWAEAAIMHLRALWGNDRPAGLVQWFSWIGAVIGASGLAQALGGNKRTQWMTAVFAFTIPMGLLQATTTQNDLVSAFWAVALAYFVVVSRTSRSGQVELLGVALSLSLGMLTKGTFFPFAFPFMIWFLVDRLRIRGFRTWLKDGLLIGLAVLVLNAGYWTRNVHTYGGPFGQNIPVQLPGGANQGASELGVPAPEAEVLGAGFLSEGILERGSAALRRLVRMFVMNFVTPIGWFNRGFFALLERFPELFHNRYLQSLRLAAWNHEMTAGNPLHVFLAAVSAGGLVAAWKAGERKQERIIYVLLPIAGLILLSLIEYADRIFSIRYQLSYLLLAAPAIGIGLARLPFILGRVLMAGLLVYSLPYALLSNMRPVIGRTPWPTRIESVFTTAPETILFAQSPTIADEYSQITEEVRAERCQVVGLDISSRDLEYTFWWLLGAPGSEVTIRHVGTSRDLPPPMGENLEPCAVICTECDDAESYNGLPRRLDGGHVVLFMKPE